NIVDSHKVGGGSPGKVVNIFAAKAEGGGAIGVGLLACLDAAGAHDVTLGKREVNVVGTKIGKEFCVGVVLMAIPRAMPQHAHLGEPLRSHDEIPLVSVSGNRQRKFVVKGDVEANCLT